MKIKNNYNTSHAPLKNKEVDQILRANGYRKVRQGNTSHAIYKNAEGKTVSVPITSKGVNIMLFKRLVKDNGIIFNNGIVK